MIEQIQFAKLFGITRIDNLLQEMLLGGKTCLIIGIQLTLNFLFPLSLPEREANGDSGNNGSLGSEAENQQNLAPAQIPSSNSGLMTLSDEDSIDPTYVVSPPPPPPPSASQSSSSHSHSSPSMSMGVGFKQEPHLDPDPRFA